MKFRIQTPLSKKGCLLFAYKDNSTLCCLPVLVKESKIMGNVLIRNIETDETTCIKAHQSKISALAIDYNVENVATSSEEGTTIRVFQIKTGLLLHQIKREFTSEPISCLSFDTKGVWILANDPSGDFEIFCVTNLTSEEEELTLVKNRKSFFRFLGNFIPYFLNEWSFAKHNSFQKEAISYTRFMPDVNNNILKLNENGMVEIISFDKLYGGYCMHEGLPKNFLYNDVEI